MAEPTDVPAVDTSPADDRPEGDSGDPTSGRGRARRVAPLVAIAIAVVLAGMIWMLANADVEQGESADTPLIGQVAPDSTGTLADGSAFDLSRRKGSWVVLNFFTHNCVPCIREHPELVEFAEQQEGLGTSGAELYSIVRDSTREQVEEFFAERGGEWPVVYDDRYEFVNDFGVALVPETWIIDPSGTVRARYITEVRADELSAVIQSMREAGP